MNAEIVGYGASLCTTLAFVPQVVQIVRSRDVAAISLPMYAVFTAGIALWLAYGLLLGSRPIVVANAVTLLLSASVLVMKLRFRR